MPILSIDIETYSSLDLRKCGVYAYTEAEDFEILLFSYAFDDEEVKVVDLKSGEEIPIKVLKALSDINVIKTAFNANFERTCLEKHFDLAMPPEQWRCTAVQSLVLGLPSSLDNVAKVLKCSYQKMKEGKTLIRYFSMPCTATKSNGMRERNLPQYHREKWDIYKKYCAIDVEVERNIRRKLENYTMLEKQWKLWQLDQRINDFGVKVDKQLVEKAIKCHKSYEEKLMKEAINITKLGNPNSPAQLKKWLEKQGIKVDSLSKAKVRELLEQVEEGPINRVLQLRQELSKTSVKKYEAMERALCKDHKLRGLMKFYGANRTGRWAGRLVQIHNLPRNNMKDLEYARKLLKSGDYDMLEILFPSVTDLLSQLIRTVFIPSPGSRFIIVDYSAIEARVIAWLAGQKWVIDTFKSHGKIYEMTASKMFNVPMEHIVKGREEYELRQKGKVATLACGYQGGKGALLAMGALKMGLKEEELPAIVSAWRESNFKIVQLWRQVEKAAITAVNEKKVVSMQYGLKFIYKRGVLFITLPSGRSLAYLTPRIEKDPGFNKLKLTYEGIEQKSKQWGRLSTYGGKLVENIVQAIARDCLAESLLRLDKRGYKTVFHVHDEVILDVPNGFGSLEEVKSIMEKPMDWAPSLPLRAEGFETKYYKKE